MDPAKRLTIGNSLAPVVLAAVLLWTPCAAHPGIDEQIADLTERIAADGQDAVLYLRRGELHRIHRDWPKAEADYAKALRLDPDLLAARMCLGRMKLDAGEPAEARAVLDVYLAKRPDDPVGLVTRARALERLSLHLEAARDYDAAIASPKDRRPKPEYFLERAQALAAAGAAHYAEALRGLDEGLERLGRPVTLQNFAVELELKRRNFDAALDRLDRMWSGMARRETWLTRRGEILEAAGRFDEARAAYRGTLDAIDALPASRQANRAVARLADEARAGVARLDDKQAAR